MDKFILRYILSPTAMAGSALRRLMTEYRELFNNAPHGVVAGPASEDNFFEWDVLIQVGLGFLMRIRHQLALIT